MKTIVFIACEENIWHAGQSSGSQTACSFSPVCRAGKNGAETGSKYDLVANLCHDGKAGEGSYRVHIHRKVEEAWYEVQDLLVSDFLPQMVALSETYMQVWQLKDQ